MEAVAVKVNRLTIRIFYGCWQSSSRYEIPRFAADIPLFFRNPVELANGSAIASAKQDSNSETPGPPSSGFDVRGEVDPSGPGQLIRKEDARCEIRGEIQRAFFAPVSAHCVSQLMRHRGD